MAFAAYNAGPGRVAQWIAAYGDPRNGADPVDWVERIPFDETRDYVQRVSENLAVYRQRFAEEAVADRAAFARRWRRTDGRLARRQKKRPRGRRPSLLQFVPRRRAADDAGLRGAAGDEAEADEAERHHRPG